MRAGRAKLQTRTPETEDKYLRRAGGLLARLAADMKLPEDTYPPPSYVVDFLRRSASEWKWATFRQYQASLACFYQVEFERTGDSQFASVAGEIRSLPWERCKPEGVVGGTSSRKRKGIPERDYDVLVANLSTPMHGGRWAQHAARWLQSALATGLRPCEWRDARLAPDEALLEVVNAKATNGRANGASRTVPLRAEDIGVVRAHLESLRVLMEDGYTFDQIHKRCSDELRRACLRIWGKGNARRYALYSARHQFAANSKAQHSHTEVAELLGHASIKTARRHYAPRRSAWARWRSQQQPTPQPVWWKGPKRTT